MAKSLGAGKFRVKIEIRNSPAELARPYGTPAADIATERARLGSRWPQAQATSDAQRQGVQQLGRASPKKKPPLAAGSKQKKSAASGQGKRRRKGPKMSLGFTRYGLASIPHAHQGLALCLRAKRE